MIYFGTALENVPPYIEGTEPAAFPFRLGDGSGQVLYGYNFTEESIQRERPITLVLDMFQRLVYSSTTRETVIRHAHEGRMEEPVVSSPYRNYIPNFIPTDANGRYIEKSSRDRNPFYLHHLSSGTCRLHGKLYAPIQVTYLGGEEYLDDSGEIQLRRMGELRFDPAGRPLYLLRRRIRHDNRHFALHDDFFFAKDLVGKNAFLVSMRSDSPFLAEYVDRRPCNFDIKPIPIAGVFPEEWELTGDHTKAQLNDDICIVPEAADGECFVKGEIMCFRRRVAFSRIPRYNPQTGRTLQFEWANTPNDDKNPTREELAELLKENPHFWTQVVGYTYYEVVPYPEYFEPLRGQGVTESYYFRELSNYIEPANEHQADHQHVTHYARLHLVKGVGVPEFHNEERVCRLCEYSPSRGIFLKTDEDGIRYPIMVTPYTSEGFGIPVATLHHTFDEQTYQCTDIVEHKRHKLVRHNTELLLTAEDECWRQCGKIEGTIPPDLGNPNARPRRIIFIERNPDVSGQMPDLTALMPGTYINLVTGQIHNYSDYQSNIPIYPEEPYPEVMWNPGELTLDGEAFVGFATSPAEPFPLFMLSGDVDTGTLFPVWHPQALRHTPSTVTVEFAVGDASMLAFHGTLPERITLSYGSELDLIGYGDETMKAYGLHFGGWSVDPIFLSPVPRIPLVRDIILFGIWYSARVPYSRPQTCTVSFGGEREVHVHRSSVIRLRGFNPAGLTHPGYRMVGWNTSPNSQESLFHLIVRGDVFLFPVWQPVAECNPFNPICPLNPYFNE